jgi:hypothetical protein
MNELKKRNLEKDKGSHLDRIHNIHNKHMELLTDLMKHPTLGTDILDIKERKDVLLNSNLLHTELEPPYKKQSKTSEEKTD